MWVAVEVNAGTFGSNVTEVNNRPIGTKRFVCDESHPLEIYNSARNGFKLLCAVFLFIHHGNSLAFCHGFAL